MFSVILPDKTGYCNQSLQQRQKHKVQYEQEGAYPENRMNLFCLLLADLYDAVEDKARRDTLGNAVAQSHHKAGEKCRNRLTQI